ncbi:Predicted ATPase [Geodermatophilus siccatus]|uniref:Predicted ATPase n=1 Tax=Geodermatophilus siccatus TaxID=1137991 RepID=A0A1G9YAZ7_9ACTN|nr:BTAD domain-containing putative transcriptional regulator [Geodermatophilus siccatus]SDN05705.1 Predicted ATPase [Geodermatophilus siccatus]
MSGDQAAGVRVEVLGPLRLVVDGRVVDVRGPKRRAVLALLALAEGRTVPVDTLVDALWPSEVPESGRQALHSHVSRLRGHLGSAAARLETEPDGYRLVLEGDALDVARARALLAAARSRGRQDPAGALAVLREARALWRGPVLSDLTDVLPIAAAVEECTRLLREVTDALIGSAIAAGKAEEVLGLAAASLADDPLREPAVLLLVRALAATGRAPEALRTARGYRQRLAEETGLDPSPELDQLEREVAGGAAGPVPGPRVSVRPATRLIGRDAEVAALHRRLESERLVTLVGPGGVGKTRVAVEVARRSGTTATLLLAPVTDPAAVPHALAAALGLEVVRGDVLAACVAVLGDRPGLLVVDNCEHLLDAVRDAVDAVLSACPRVAVLATSREPLGLAAECVVRLAPLPLPDGDRDLARVPSVAVFLDRADRVRPGPPPTPDELRTVADIVHRLDGMPLAIELAAGRLSTFSLTDLRSRLTRSLDLLGGGRPSGDARHRTLRATVEWSYQLLSEDERRLFRQLSVFVDGVDLGTAERLAADLDLGSDPGSVLARLVDASMVEADIAEGGARYRMLDTLRAFGLDRLAAAGEREAATDRMQRWAVELAAWFAATTLTDREPEADAVLRREVANLRAAWRSARSRGALDDAIAMVLGLYDAVTYRDLVELRSWAEELAADPALTGHPREAAVLGTAGEAAYHRGDLPTAVRLARAGLDRATDAIGTGYCLLPLSVVALARGAYAEAAEHALAAAALRARPGELLGIAALALAYAGDADRARSLNDRGLAEAVSPSMRAFGAYVTGEIETSVGRRDRAEPHYVRAIDLARTAGATFVVGIASVGLLPARADAGRVREALVGYREVVDYFARTGNWTHQWTTLRNLADLLRRLGDEQPADLLDAASDRAPDAAARSTPPRPATVEVPDRAAVLEVARLAIERNLTRA